MRENRLSGSEGGGIELNRFSLPLSRRSQASLGWRQSQPLDTLLRPGLFTAGPSGLIGH
jgi:hypothetical protein